jgi:hypothetical protein
MKKKQSRRGVTRTNANSNFFLAHVCAMPPKKLQFALTTRRDSRQPHYY